MGALGLLKRFLPFFATFALGLFISSLFFDVGLPRFRGPGRYKQVVRENEQLKKENFELRRGRFHCEPPIDLDTGEETGDGTVYRTIPYDAPPPPPRAVAPRMKR